jgi:Tfp pilus assembly protein PilV
MNAHLHGRDRSGFVLQEAMMAVALALAGVVGVAHLLGIVAQQRRTARQQAAAVGEAGNLMEDLASRRWNEITPQHAASLGLSEECRRALADGNLQVDVVSEDQDSKRISIRIDWRTASGRRGEPVRLVGWRFRDEEARP